MISKKEIVIGFGLISERWKPLSMPLQRIYIEYLDPILDDETFTRGVRKAIVTRDFLPSPQQIAEDAGFIAEPPELRGGPIFDHIVNRLSSLSTRHDGANIRGWKEEDVLESHGPEGLRAFQAIGGSTALRASDPEGLLYLRRDFIKYYATSVAYLDATLPPEGRMKLLARATSVAYIASPPPNMDPSSMRPVTLEVESSGR